MGPIQKSAEQIVGEIKELPRPPKGLEGEKGVSWPWWALPLASHVTDGISTTYALGRNPNTRESNPLVAPFADKTPAWLAFKLGLGAATALGVRELGKKNPTLAKVASVVGSAVPAGATVNNMIIAGKGKK